MNSSIKELIIDGSTVDRNPASAFRGLGAVTGNNSSRLLMDYKAKSPDSYWEIMELLFRPDYGAGLTHVKIELGADINSSSGTEPCVKRDLEEPADVTRGAGFMFAADAKKINPEITVDFLRWGEPAWVSKAFSDGIESGFDARYRWYKETIDAAYDEFGLKIDYVSADSNETGKADAQWIIYFSHRLKEEKNTRYDYSAIKIVASDEVGTRNIAAQMMENSSLREAIDVIGLHYTTYGDENTEILNSKYGKEIWYSEGISPCNISSLSINCDGSGICGINSVIDVTNRIINSYCHGSMVMYEYQPAVSSYYTGSNYTPKYLISAEQPWSGFFEIGSGLWGAAHITRFVKKGWKFIKSGCFGDGKENHHITETTENHIALMSESGDYTLILTNDSDKPRYYDVCVRNIEKWDEELHCIETRGPEAGGRFDSSWFRVIDKIIPANNKTGCFYRLEVKPFSIMTCTTLGVESVNGTESVRARDNCPSHLELTYSDSFNYSSEFTRLRGGAPLYTTDQGGAFEIRKCGNENILEQIITEDIIPTDWRFRGTPTPATNLGDDSWSNYTVRVEAEFDGFDPENYVGVGLRYNSAVTCDYSAECGYQLRIFPDGKWQLRYFDNVVAEGKDGCVNQSGWNSMRITAKKNRIKCVVNRQILCEYITSPPMILSGRVSLYSAYYNNRFRNLSITPVIGYPTYSLREDCLSNGVVYSDGWNKNAMDSFRFYNRTSAAAEKKGAYFEYEFSGETVALMGEAENLRLKIEIDGRIMTAGLFVEKCGSKQIFYYKNDLNEGRHKMKVIVLEGRLSLDCILTDETQSVNRKLKSISHQKKKSGNKLKKSTLLIGAGLAAAGAGIILLGKKFKKTK